MIGPDENAYLDHAIVFHEEGRKGVRTLVEEYFANTHGEQERPSPLRWGAMVLGGVFVRLNKDRGLVWASRFFALVTVLFAGMLVKHFGGGELASFLGMVLAGSSPLLETNARRMLVETWVSAFALGALLAFLTGHVVLGTVGLILLVSTKESSVLLFPGVLIPGLPLIAHLNVYALGLSLLVSLLAYVAGFYVVGGRQFFKLFDVATRGHGHSYTRAFQSGPPHRVLVDLAIVSPLAIVGGLITAHDSVPLFGAVFAILLFHAFTPLKNVRVLVTADILLRVLVMLGLSHCPWWMMVGYVALFVFVDLFILRTLKTIYDPVTAELVSGFKMVPKAIWKVEL